MILSVQNLDVHYGVIQALHGVSLQIDRGEIVTLIGANGAGKTSLLRTISGLIQPTEGAIYFAPEARRVPALAKSAQANGDTPPPGSAPVLEYRSGDPGPAGQHALHTLGAHQIVQLGVSHVPEGRQIFANLTVVENLRLGAYTRESAV